MNLHAATHAAGAPAGHAHHFLSRLDRVARAHVDFALMLYRDEDLVHFILDRAALPEGVERVALSLEDAKRGPFLILTRGGRFVTCLGAGMKPADRMIVTRAQLDGHIARAREMRARNEALIDLGDRAKDVYKRVIDAADELSREQIMAASASATPIRAQLVGLAAEVCRDLYRMRETLVPILRRTRSPRAPVQTMLRIYWKLAFAAGHLTMLAGVDGPGLVEKVPPLLSEHGPLLSLLAVEQGISAMALKGLWAAGKVGRELLPAYKHVLATSTCPLRIADAALGLTVLGLRHARLRAEVYKALGAPHDGVGRTPDTRELAAAVCATGRAVLDNPQKALAAHRTFGAARYTRMTAHLPANSPWRHARPEDVPEDLAMTVGASAGLDFRADTQNLLRMFAFLPWLARAKAPNLYLPADLIRALRCRWQPAHTMAIFEGLCARPPTPKPTPSRSGPCPCGSGKKYKRCCGEARPEPEMRTAA
ncbi:MAG: SEC-C metal-binding domain-containing protein [Minicystis sp.]